MHYHFIEIFKNIYCTNPKNLISIHKHMIVNYSYASLIKLLLGGIAVL